jgi:hypothetical protein
MRLRVSFVATAVASCLLTPPLAAQPADSAPPATPTAPAAATPQNEAAAHALFDQGKALHEQGRHAEAVAKLEHSRSLRRSVATAWVLAEAYAAAGRLASAWASYRALADDAELDATKRRLAATRAAELKPKLPLLSVKLGANASLPGIEVKRGAFTVDPSLADSPLPVDPGSYRILVTAPGHRFQQLTVTAFAGKPLVVTVPPLEPLPLAQPAHAGAVARPATRPGAAPTAKARPKGAAGARKASGDKGAAPEEEKVNRLGVASITLGAGALFSSLFAVLFSVRAVDKNDEAAALCPQKVCPDPAGIEAADQAVEAANFATVSVVASAVAGVASIGLLVLYLRDDDEQPPDAEVSFRPLGGRGAALTFTGRF